MTPEFFDELVESFRKEEDKILLFKRGEYARSEDRLENFRDVANLVGLKPSQIALIYLLKHVQSIAQQVMTESYTWAWFIEDNKEGLKQRVADAVNYLHLMAACLESETLVVRSGAIDASKISTAHDYESGGVIPEGGPK